uniref:Putative toll-like receptor 6 n=1 Tax=Ixodes ricinus TaxID=34613 RepID=A0A090X7P0_IXORI
MCFSGVNSFFVVLIVATFMSQLCEARNWRRVNTTCPALKQCECSLVVSGAYVRCSNFVKMVDWKNGTDLKEDMDRLQNTSIRKLTLSGVNVEVLPASWFSNLSVFILIINHSPLKYIEDTAFNGINRVSKVMLENNMLMTIPRALKSFKVLKSLHIPRNLIKAVNDELYSLGELKELNLRSNLIEKIDEDALKNQVHLNKLYLQNNRLEDIPPLLFKNTKHLEHIDLHGNRIKAIGDSIRDMPFLKSNQLSTMHRKSFPNSLMTLETLAVDGNPLLCDCQITWLLDSLPPGTKRGVPVCASPPRLAGRMLYNLTVNDLVAWPEDCDNGCTCQCHEDSMTGWAVHVNCSGGDLKQLPRTFPENARKLDLSGNSVEHLDERLVAKAPGLRSLSLRGNLLSSVDRSTIPENVTVLDLRDNRLKRFPLDLVSTLNLTRIWLAGNPWSCDCEDYAFRQWAEGHSDMIQDADEIFCAEGFNVLVSLKSFMEVGQKELCPSVVSKAVSYGIFMLVLAAAALTVSTAYFKYKREIKVWLYARGLCGSLQCIKEDDLDEEKSFDIFLSFSSKDSSWAYEHLIPRVEAHGFTVCTYDRNFKGGFLIQDIIHEAVACSRRTVLLLSENFVQSEWCRWEFRVAHHQALEDNINRLIVIVVDEAASNAVDDELRIYMQATNYLRWGETHFWDKLLYSLPKKDSHRKVIPNSQEYPMAAIARHL